MIPGIAIGLFSALMQSVSYVLSRRFVFRYHSPLELMLYSTVGMGAAGLLALPWLLPYLDINWSGRFFLWLAVFAATMGAGAFCFFQALQEIEASRLSSLQGLKFIPLTPLSMIFTGAQPGKWQFLAIFLAMVSAVGMNFSGAKLRLRGCIFLALALICYALTDIAGALLPGFMGSKSLTLNAFAATSFAYIASALVPVLVLLHRGFDRERFTAALPYALLWYTAMVILFASFGIIGVMYGTIIQASRGVISVILGVILLKTKLDTLEPEVSAGAWVRRTVMALIMLGAMICYTWK